MSDLISRQQAIEIVERYNKSHMVLKQQPMLGAASIVIELEELPSVQPERKDVVEKAVAAEAISDELMSRFDVSATYAYDVAESAVNRIEVMAKEMGDR